MSLVWNRTGNYHWTTTPDGESLSIVRRTAMSPFRPWLLRKMGGLGEAYYFSTLKEAQEYAEG